MAPCGHTTAADVPDDCLVIGLDAQARDDLAVLLRTGRPLFDEVRNAVRLGCLWTVQNLLGSS